MDQSQSPELSSRGTTILVSPHPWAVAQRERWGKESTHRMGTGREGGQCARRDRPSLGLDVNCARSGGHVSGVIP